MTFPLYSAGPICTGYDCLLFTIPFYIDQYAWLVVGVIALCIAFGRLVFTKRVDRIVGIFLAAGVCVLLIGWYRSYTHRHRFDAQSRSAITLLGSDALWPSSLPDGWRLTRLVSEVYGKEPQSAYVYATFQVKGDDAPHTLHEFNEKHTNNEGYACGYVTPEDSLSQNTNRASLDVGCSELYTLPSNRVVYKRPISNSRRVEYFMRQDGLVVVLESKADENHIKAFFARLEKTPADKLPFIAE
ncbi:hypothetical protein IT415_02020 [bacterium]|nr:hypothetical protein [bacterium]